MPNENGGKGEWTRSSLGLSDSPLIPLSLARPSRLSFPFRSSSGNFDLFGEDASHDGSPLNLR